MVMKDISAVDALERAVRADPTVLPEVTDRLDEQLAAADPSTRMDAGRALRAAAEHDPVLVLPYCDVLVDLLDAEHGSLRLSGAIGLAEVAAVAPEDVQRAVPALLDVFEDTVAPAIEEAVVRALTRVGLDDPEAVVEADAAFAGRLPDATFPVQTVIVRSFVGVVTAAPERYPETVEAYATFLANEADARARSAADALARVAAVDPTVLPDVERVLSLVETLETQVDADPRPGVGEDVKEAARTLRRVSG